MFYIPMIAFLYAPIVLLVGLVFVFKNKNKNNEVLLASAYIVGAEVLIRMSGNLISHEFAKYLVMIFMFLGILYSGTSKKSILYFIAILLLLPGVFVGLTTLSEDVNIRKAIAFNLTGSLTLILAAIYTFKREVTYEEIKKIFFMIGYPLISILIYVFLYTPSLKEAITGTDSNFSTSGGFGPNQVSTVLGMGIFVFFSLGLLFSKNKLESLLYYFISILFAYRSLLTFSRGGFLTGIIIIFLLLIVLFFNIKPLAKLKLLSFLVISISIGCILFIYTASQTNNLIVNRYTGKDALGREKTSKFSGREKLAETELEIFFENPVFGIGVGRNKEERLEKTGNQAASHNEITRLLAEHGIFGFFTILLFILIPLFTYFTNRSNIFALSFLLFWFLTINHAAMRIAAPAFIYALTLLNVKINAKKPSSA